MDRFGDLHRQLAGRHQNKTRGLSRARTVLADPVQHGKRKGGSLARACGRLPEQVAALKQQRNRFALHRRRLFVAEGRNNVRKFAGKSQGGKINRVRRV